MDGSIPSRLRLDNNISVSDKVFKFHPRRRRGSILSRRWRDTSEHLKVWFSTAQESSGHSLFISAFMIVLKVICDDTYSNESCPIVAQDMFTLSEINLSDGARNVQLSQLGANCWQSYTIQECGYFQAYIVRSIDEGLMRRKGENNAKYQKLKTHFSAQ
jgi:hypothetical protein